MTTMRAAVVHEFGTPLQVDELPAPEPGPGQALVKLVTSGVCHTDLHAAHGDWPVKPSPPFIPGHEGVGEVVALGEGVTTLSEGDLVGNAWLWSACGVCEYCRTGWETLCEEQQNGGYVVDGSFGQYMLVDERFAARIPQGADPVEVAPVLCAGVTVYKGLKVTDTRPGDWVVISGIGGLGHMAVQYAKAMGLNVAAVDVDDAKLDLATRLGASVTVNARTTDPVAFLKKEIGGAHGALVTAVFAVIVEALADAQKAAFRADPRHEGEFVRGGLWSWSRHPNYVGEVLVWTGVALVAAAPLVGWQHVTLHQKSCGSCRQ